MWLCGYMDKKFLIKFAFRNLLAHPLRSFLTLMGIVIGVGAIIFLVSLGFGIERLVAEQVSGGDAFRLVDVGTGNSQIINLNQKSVKQIQSLSNVKSAEFIINIGGKAKKAGQDSMDVAIYGSSQDYLNWLGVKAKWGSNFNLSKEPKKILVNTAFLKFLGSSAPESYLGQQVTFDAIIPKELSANNQNIEAGDQKYEIGGVIQDDAGPNIYLAASELEKLGAVNYSQVKIEMKDRNNVVALRKQIENMGFKTQYVGDTVNQIQEIFNIFKIILGSFGFVALVVAALGMFNTLTISLLERIKEVALLKILGMKRRDINRLFLTEATIFGSLGGLLGIALGIGLGKVANAILNYFALNAGGDRVSVFYYSPWFIAVVVVFSLLIGMITGLYPARRATRVKALDVLRYE